MKCIIATSKRIGLQNIWVSDEDFDKVSKCKCYVRVNKYDKVIDVVVNTHLNGCRRTVSVASYILEAYKDRTMKVIYIDGNKLNNTRPNLLIKHLESVIEYSDNNYGVKQRPGTSRFRGVILNKTRTGYMPMVKYKGRSVYMGVYPNTPAGELDAAIARDIKVLELFGDRAILNFPISTLRVHCAERVNEKYITGSDATGWLVDIPITPRTTVRVGDYGTLADAIKARNEYIINWGGESALNAMLQ